MSEEAVIRPSKGDVFFKVQLRLVPYIRIEITFMFLFRRLRENNANRRFCSLYRAMVSLIRVADLTFC